MAGASASAFCSQPGRRQAVASYWMSSAVVLLVYMAAMEGVCAQYKPHKIPSKCRQGNTLPANITLQRPAWRSESSSGRHFQEWPRPWKGVPRPNSAYHSGGGEDRYFYETFFYEHIGGSYLEIGGHNGIDGSNTYWLHEQLGWRGMLIEANPGSYKNLVKSRPADFGLHAAICKTASVVHYADRATVSGIYEFMSEKFKKRWWSDVDVSKLMTIDCVPLGGILGMLNIRHFNFFSLDVEGAELQVLESLDLDCVSFDVLCIEADGTAPEKEAAIKALLEKNGYKLHSHVQTNDWFIHSGLKPHTKPVEKGA